MHRSAPTRASAAAWLSIMLWMLSALLAPAFAQTSSTPPQADCHAGTLVTVVAHLDDDLLFVNPGISDKLAAGWCVTTVHLIGGANGANFDYVKLREKGTRLAYARMAGVPDEWIESTVDIAGKPVHQMVLKQQPRVKLLELRMPGGGVRGGRVPLGLLWDQGATIETYPLNADGTNTTHYDRPSLIATVRAILTTATEIYTLNPDTVPFIEHPDHIYAARITRVAAQQLGRDIPIGYHVTYPTGALPKNLDAADTQKKRDDVASYFAVDGDDNGGHVFGEYQWDGNWVARRYWTRAHASDPGPDFQPHPMQLVNEYSSQCLTSAGPGVAPRLTTCDQTRPNSQAWQWHQVAGTPGTNHTAQLVDGATRQCVAERNGGLVEEPCNPADAAQKWTPWDFGIVYTPLGHCLAGHNGALLAGSCSSPTAESRWAPSSKSQWTDVREEGAMFGNVRGATGDGRPSAVYVQRRKDGPGFNVWVADMSRLDTAQSWYLNAVPFNPKATAPTCSGDTLCFDSVRFLLGDFEGNGRDDLMVISPLNGKGGTAFWLMRSNGVRFEAPRLWAQTSAALTPANAQQYVAGDFTGEGHADVMIANKGADTGLDLWVVAPGHAPALWMKADGIGSGARFLPMRTAGSRRTGLVAIENVGDSMAVTQLSSSGSAFSGTLHGNVYQQFSATMTKVAAGDIEGNGTDDLVLLQPHGDGPDVDVWTIKGGTTGAQPMHAGTLRESSFADAMPAIVSREHQHTLVLFKRANAKLDGFYFTAGAPMLIGFDFDSALKLGPAQIWSELPGQFSETLWLRNLSQ
jgi:LmbE family N-acetylglucosaminyl deacetylase